MQSRRLVRLCGWLVSRAANTLTDECYCCLLSLAPRFRCETCGNTDQNNFITDYARGDTICNGLDGNGCGTVVQDHIVHEGSAYRKFEGEEDKSHHGPAPNKLFSTGHNLRTLISQVRLLMHTSSCMQR